MEKENQQQKSIARIAGESIAKRAGLLSIMSAFAVVSSIFVRNMDLTSEDIIEITSKLSRIGSSAQLHCPLDSQDIATSIENCDALLSRLEEQGVYAIPVYTNE